MEVAYSMDFSQWLGAFAKIQMRARDTEPAHEKIGDLLIDETRDNIESQPSDWRALSFATLERRRREHPDAGDKMLIVTRALIDSITKDARDAWVDVGSALRKARTLFFGRDNIPARFPFRWRGGVMSQVGRIYLNHLFGRLQ